MTPRTPGIERAIELAARWHAGSTDKTGAPYIFHPLRVMEAVRHLGLEHAIVGVLHDVVEDSDCTLEDLRREGFSEAVVRGVDSMTKRTNEPYLDAVRRAKADPIGRHVKLADLQDNQGRLPQIADAAKRQEFEAKYKSALAELST